MHYVETQTKIIYGYCVGLPLTANTATIRLRNDRSKFLHIGTRGILSHSSYRTEARSLCDAMY